MERYRQIEKSIIKKYRKKIWSPFMKAVREYELVKEGDKIAVCISGGKDSFLLAKCLLELKRHGMVNFDLEFLIMNPGYSDVTYKQIEENLKILNIDAHIFSSDIFKVSLEKGGDNPCYLCARMRRGFLYSKALSLGCNKIALGHHFNDVIETVLMNLIYTGQYSSMMPKLHSTNFHGMELIRPLYFVHEEDIISWAKYNDLKFIDCACTVTKKKSGKRLEIKLLINKLKEVYENVDLNIMKSTMNVNVDTIISYKKKGCYHSFLEDYDSTIEDE